MAVERIGVSLGGPLLEEFDRLVASEGFPSRSEALRELIRRALVGRDAAYAARRDMARRPSGPPPAR